jgi:hypothetical protein
MKHPWQQPIRPMEVRTIPDGLWVKVLFIRPERINNQDRGWEVISTAGTIHCSDSSYLRWFDE